MSAQSPFSQTGGPSSQLLTSFPHLVTGDNQLDSAFRIALGDLVGNIVLFKDGLLDDEVPVILAGLGYDTPWTRDAAINTWNGAGMLFPEVTCNTLLSVLERKDGVLLIGGQYWDAIIWTIGAWWYYLYTGDREFLLLSYEAVRNSLYYFESTEFEPRTGLFRGPACYADGVSAYPDVYTHTKNGSSSILDWPIANPDLTAPTGYGLPMQALSTNCLYYKAYVLLERMATELAVPVDSSWQRKAEDLKRAIHKHFWDPAAERFWYLVDPFGGCTHQEGLGHSFALLFGITNGEEAASIFRHQHITPAGIPCVWPTFPRYESEDSMSFGRHSGTVWPHIQAFWAHAAANSGQEELFAFELEQLAKKSYRDSQFAELYHPITGAIYGGVQEKDGPISSDWTSNPRQTWSATGLLRVILMGLLGMRFEPEGIHFQPMVPRNIKRVEMRKLRYRNALLDIIIHGPGSHMAHFAVNGEPSSQFFLPAGTSGEQQIIITMEPR